MKTKAKTQALLSSQIRAIIERSGRSVNDLEVSAGIPRGSLSRFVAGTRSITLATLDKLTTELGIRVFEVEKRPVARRRESKN